MVALTHISLTRLAPGLCAALAVVGVILLPHSLAIGFCVVLMAGSFAIIRAPRPEASSRIAGSTWTVRYGAEVTALPLDRITEVRIDHPHNGPDRVQVLMNNGLCVPLPNAALPDPRILTAALRARNVTVHQS